MKIGDIVKKYRADKGVSVREFAEKTGLSSGYVSMLENGINPRSNKPISPTIPSLKKVALGLDVDLDGLLRMIDEGQEVSLARNEPDVETFGEKKILATFKQLNEINRRKSIRYTENLLANQKLDKELFVSAAHERTDIEVTDEMRKHDDDIMNNPDEWE